MNNVFTYMLAIVVTLQCYIDSITAIKINSSLNVINEELIIQCLSEQSKLEANNSNDLSLLSLKQDLLKEEINVLLEKNIGFLSFQVKYYFYDSKTLSSCPIGYDYCNSVQFVVSIDYKNKTYEKVYRYEPIEV